MNDRSKRPAKWNDSRDRTRRERLEIGFDHLRDRWPTAPAAFDRDSLTICGHPVMERWEDGYMSRLAAVAGSQGGRVLEVGFGLGISAAYLQTQDISSHTIIEANEGVFRRLLRFAETARVPVTPLLGFWEDVAPVLPDESFSGVLFDTYPLDSEEIHCNHLAFLDEAHRLLRPGGVLTYYSDEVFDYSDDHLACLRQAGFSKVQAEICPVEPPADCRYWKEKSILVPIVVK